MLHAAAPRPSVPANAATEDHGGQQTQITNATGYATPGTAIGARVKARRNAASHSAAKLRAALARIGMLLLQPRLQAAPRRRRPLLAHQLRHPATGWAPRRRDAAVVAELEREASDHQREEFCARKHNGEHGGGSASGQKGQGGLSAPSAAALLAPRASRFATRSHRREETFEFSSGLRLFWVRLAQSAFFKLLRSCAPKHENNNAGTVMKMQARATAPLERLSPTPLHFPLMRAWGRGVT